MSEPTRLYDQRDASSDERRILAHGREQPATPYDVDAGEARFRAALVGLAAASATSAASATMAAGTGHAVHGGLTVGSLLSNLWLKCLLGLCAGGALVGISYVIAPREIAVHSAVGAAADVGATADARTRPAAVPAAPGAPPPERASPAPLPQVFPLGAAAAHSARPSAPGAVQRAKRRPGGAAIASASTLRVHGAPSIARPQREDQAAYAARAGAPHTDSAGARSPAPRPEDAVRAEAPQPAPMPRADTMTELREVARARGLVRQNPAAALRVLDALRDTQPSGYLLEERHALRVLALLGTQQHAVAREQAAIFLRRYPDGPFSDSVRIAAGLR